MSKSKNTAEKKPMTLRELIVSLAAVGAGLIVVEFARIRRAYYLNYETVWVTLYLAFAILGGLAYRWYIRRFKPLQEAVDRLRPLWRAKGGGILVGRSIKHGVKLYLPDEARTGHVQIIAATGRGKTVSVIEPWLVRDLKLGRSAVLIDGKGDPELVERVRRAMRTLGLRYQITVLDLGNPEKSATTNPLAHGSAQQITDRLFTSFEFEDPFYRSVQYRAAGLICALLQSDPSDGTITFKRLYDSLTSQDALSDVMNRCEDEGLKRQAMRLLHQEPREREKQLMGLISQLEPLAVGEVAPLLNGELGDREFATISRAILTPNSPQLFIALLPTLKYQAIGQQIGKCLLQELAWAVGERSSRGGGNYPFTPVYLDEFSAFVYPGFHQTLNKARSSQVAFHLSHQSLGDFKIVEPELATIIQTNTNVKCLLGLNDPDTADFFAKHLGTSTEEKLTERGRTVGIFGRREKTGEHSVREVEAYRIHPNRLKNYTRGVGVLHLPTERGNVTEEIQFEALCEEDFKTKEGVA